MIDIPRPHIGTVPYSPQLIHECAIPGTVAVTFDDGPDRYTSYVLDVLDEYDSKGTFFITGTNGGRGRIDDPTLPWPKLIRRMHESGHQIASHTWSHQDLNTGSNVQRYEELTKNEAALRNILGAFPTYIRPPYTFCDAVSGCLQFLGELGYHVIFYSIDPKDYANDSPDLIQNSKTTFDASLAPYKASDKSWIVLTHDVHEQTAHNLTRHMLQRITEKGYRAVTVGECLGDPSEFWYRRDTRHASPESPNEIASSSSSSVDLCAETHCASDCQKGNTYCALLNARHAAGPVNSNSNPGGLVDGPRGASSWPFVNNSREESTGIVQGDKGQGKVPGNESAIIGAASFAGKGFILSLVMSLMMSGLAALLLM